jgi:type I restriction enzyme, S subunit
MELKEGYKQTEVGVIPEDWDSVCLGEIASVCMCKRIFTHQTKPNGDIPFFKIGSFGGDPDAFISNELYEEYRRKYSFPSEGDILLSASGTLGKTVVFDGLDAYFQDSNIVWLEVDKTKVCNAYLYQCYQLIKWAPAEGTTISRLYNGVICATPIALPPTKAEQEAIAEALSDADALIESIEQLIEKKRQIKEGAMQQLLSGKRRLPGFSREWKAIELGDVADPSQRWSFTGGPFGSNLKSSDYIDEGIRIIQLQNIGDGEFKDNYEIHTSAEKADELVSCNIYPGDLILSKMGDPVARACIIPTLCERYLMCSDGIRLAVDQKRFNTYFIYSLINASEFRKKAEAAGTGSTRKRIGLTELRALTLCCPTFDEQTAIATILSDMDAEIDALESKLAKAHQLKSGMMHNLLTGKKRLV